MSSQRSRNGRGPSARATQQQSSEESGLWQRARDELQQIVSGMNTANETAREAIEQDKVMNGDPDKIDMASEERKQDDLFRKGVKDIEKLNNSISAAIERLEIYRALKEEEARNALPPPGTSRSSRESQGLTGRSTGRAGTREREKERERERERLAEAERQRAVDREKEKEKEKERERERDKEREKDLKEQKEQKEQRERDKEQRDRDRERDREVQRAEREREREKDRDKDREQRDRGRDRERERERDRSDRERERDRDRTDRADRADRADRGDRGDRDRDRERDKEPREKERERGDRAERGDRSDRDKEREKDPYEFDGPGDEMVVEPTTAAAVTGTGRKGGAGSSSNSSGNRDSVPPRGGDRDTPVKADSVEPQPSVANAGSSMSSAAQRSRVMFVKGQDVVFKPKPANASDSAEWFLGKVQQVLGEGKSRRYKVKDEDPDVAPEQRQEYRTSASSMIPLPPAGQELVELENGKTVLALYPDSTTFYKAEVMSTNKSLGKVNLRFEGEENSGTLQEVERRFVVEYRN